MSSYRVSILSNEVMLSIKYKVTWEEITKIYRAFTELNTHCTLLKLFSNII